MFLFGIRIFSQFFCIVRTNFLLGEPPIRGLLYAALSGEGAAGLLLAA